MLYKNKEEKIRTKVHEFNKDMPKLRLKRTIQIMAYLDKEEENDIQK